MLRTDAVIKLLKNNKSELSFDEIWNNVKEETIASISKEQDENIIKADLYTSLLEDQNLIMVGDNKWNLKSSFSFEEVEQIKKSRITEDIEVPLEESDDTIELKLSKLPITDIGDKEDEPLGEE